MDFQITQEKLKKYSASIGHPTEIDGKLSYTEALNLAKKEITWYDENKEEDPIYSENWIFFRIASLNTNGVFIDRNSGKPIVLGTGGSDETKIWMYTKGYLDMDHAIATIVEAYDVEETIKLFRRHIRTYDLPNVKKKLLDKTPVSFEIVPWFEKLELKKCEENNIANIKLEEC